MAQREGPVGVRLPREIRDKLEAAAEANERSLHGEIVHRLTQSVSPRIEGLEALGELTSLLAERMLWVAQRHHARQGQILFASLAEAFPALMAELGATSDEIDADQQTVVKFIGVQLARDLKAAAVAVEPVPTEVRDQAAEAARLVQIRLALGIPADNKEKETEP